VGPFDRSQVDLNKPATTVEEYLKQVWGAHGRHDKLNIREKNWLAKIKKYDKIKHIDTPS
jgi:hypothetical protein